MTLRVSPLRLKKETTETSTYKHRWLVFPLLVEMWRQQCIRAERVQETRDGIVEERWLSGAWVVSYRCSPTLSVSTSFAVSSRQTRNEWKGRRLTRQHPKHPQVAQLIHLGPVLPPPRRPWEPGDLGFNLPPCRVRVVVVEYVLAVCLEDRRSRRPCLISGPVDVEELVLDVLADISSTIVGDPARMTPTFFSNSSINSGCFSFKCPYNVTE